MNRGRPVRLGAAAVVLAIAGGCAGGPPAADWQVEADDALQRATTAYLRGDSRLEAIEFATARAALERTAKPELVARAELVRCATRVASLVFEPCAGFAALAQDATPAERAYSRYLSGAASADDAALLPAHHRATASGRPSARELAALEDPLSALVAAGVALRSAEAAPELIEMAVARASAQGWRRPLLAWLQVLLQRAEAAGDKPRADALRRRIALLLGQRSTGTD